MGINNISMPISIYALGGLGEVGKNTYCVENDDTLIIIDAGVRFPGVEFPGIDYIIPDYTHLKNNRNKVKALFITHGHEDHIGGIPFLLRSVDIPVIYAPRLAAALIRSRLEENKLSERTVLVEYDENTVVSIDSFKVSFFRVTHSIPDSFGVVVDTTEGRIVSTGDFKVDLTPVGPDIALTRMAELGKEGVDLMLSDSTNAENEGHTPSEKNVYDSINEVITNARGRIIVSTFSSNISRIQQVCECAVQHGRKIAIVGKSMEKAVQISRGYGYIKVPDTTFIQTQDLKMYKSSEILIICTGSQGEPMAALSRIANGEHKDIHIMPGDTVIFSSSAIPGNGLSIEKVVDSLARSGADVVTNSILSDIHSSGHPAKEELRLVLKLLKPRYFMPMHGEYRMLRIHGELATTVGLDKDRVFVLDNGDSLVLNKHKVSLSYPVEHGNVYIDGKDINGLPSAVMADRRILTDDGMIAVVVAINTKTNQLVTEPQMYMRGLIDQDSDVLKNNLKINITKAINAKLLTRTSFNELKIIIKKVTNDVIYQKTSRTPMVIPVIMAKN